MKFTIYGEKGRPTLFLLPGLGVSTEIYLPLIERLKDHFYIIAAGVDGFILGEHSKFTSVDDQAMQDYINAIRAISWWRPKYGPILDQKILDEKGR